MKIGSRPNVKRERGYANVNVQARDFGAGVGAALEGLGGSINDYGLSKTQLEGALLEKKKKNDRAKLDISLTRWQGAEQRRLMDETLNVEPGAEGFTNRVFDTVEQSWEEFKKAQNIPPELEAEYQEKFEVFRQNAATNAFAKELEESDRLIVEQVNEQLDIMAQDVNVNNQNFTKHYDQIVSVIDESGLPPSVKEEAKQNAYNKLAGSLFESERIKAQSNQMPVRAPDGTDVVAPGLAPWQRGLLNGITAFESPGGSYRSRFNGRGNAPGFVEDLSDHPRIFSPTGRTKDDGTPEVSSAAGRYQFTATTWDNTWRAMQAAGYEFDGTFSEVNQDRAAIWLAEQDFKRRTGLDLATVMNSGDREQLRVVFEMLAPTWEGLNPAFGGSFDKFANIVLGGRGISGGGTGTSEVPDVWNDPRYAGLDYATKMSLETSAQETAKLQREAQIRQRIEQETKLYDQIRIAFASGEQNAMDVAQQAIDQRAVTDADMVVKLYDLMEEEKTTRKTLTEAQSAITRGIPYTDKDGQDVYAERTGILAGVSEGSPEAAAAVADIFNRTGGIAPNVLEALEAQIYSTNPQQQQYAVQTLADLYLANPTGAMAAMSDKQAETAALASTIVQNSPDAATAANTLRTLTDPTTAPERERLKKQADEVIEEMGAGQFFDNAFGFMERNFSWVGGGVNPVLPTTPAENMQFSSDYMRLFKNHYAMLGGNEDMAHEMTGKLMSYQWQPNPLTGEIMKFSPMSPIFGNQPINGSYSWIEEKFNEDFPLEEGSEAVRTFVSTNETLSNYQKTGEVLYAVLEYDERFGGFREIGVFDARPTPEMIKENQAYHTLENINLRIESVQKQLEREANMILSFDQNPDVLAEDVTDPNAAPIGNIVRKVGQELRAWERVNPRTQQLREDLEKLERQRESLTQGEGRPQIESGPTRQELLAELNSLQRVSTREARQRMQEIQQQLSTMGAE